MSRKTKTALYLITILILFIILGTLLLFDNKEPEVLEVDSNLYGPYEVVSVIDGDTIICDIDNTDTKIRLIGIDTPESVSPDESKNTKEGEIASDYLKSLLDDKYVYLEYDVELKDKYDRTLAYVYMDDGKTMVQSLIVSVGLGEVIRIEPNIKHYDYLIEIQEEAKQSNSGFWATHFYR